MNPKKPKSKKNAIETLEIQEPIVEPGTEIVAESLDAPVTEQTTEFNAAPAGSDTEENLSHKKRKSDKTKVIRDSFSFPEHDYRKISEIKKACLTAGVHAKKGEILRAGLHLLSKLDLSELTQVLGQVEKVQTGRPSASKV